MSGELWQRCAEVGALVLGLGCAGSGSAVAPVRIFAAASAADALRAAAAGCGPEAVVVAASSATLARQIEQGAPADLFVSANPRWMDHLHAGGHIEPTTRHDLLANTLVWVGPKDRHLDFDITLLPAILAHDRLAMGDPDHVPAGVYGREALTALGVWASVDDRLARAADVRAALAFVERGEVPLGLVYATDAAASDRVVVHGSVDPSLHTPIRYPGAVVSGRGQDGQVRDLWRCLRGPEATNVYVQHGFLRP